MSDDVLHDLARRAGIIVEWQDFAGRPHTVSPDVLRRVLRALGLPADSSREQSASRRLLSRRSGFADLPPLVTGIAGRPTRLDVGGNEPHPARLVLENGEVRDVSLLPARGRLRVPAVQESGYHRLRVDDREIVLAIAPPRCREIEDVVPDARLWGSAAQVYALRNPDDGGIGDAAGIAALAEQLAGLGADALALSPLHALFAADPERFSPYAPSSRLFLNPLYAAPAMVFGQDFVAQALADAGLADLPEPTGELIDWPEAGPAKLSRLRAIFDHFLDGNAWDGEPGCDFARYRAEGGDLLQEHAVFEALQATQMPARDWRDWPVDLRDPASPTVRAFAQTNWREVLFHTFLQWLAHRSLAQAQSRARQAGMRIGLIRDMAVGTDAAGSHAWSRQQDIMLGLEVGAPPDLFNPQGQRWGLTSFSPRALELRGFAPFIATLRAVMRHAGGVRIDHAMSLSRLWLVPDGADPAEGAYLSYPTADLLRLLALESARADAVVIGEDLGTVPAGFAEMIEQSGIHGMRVLWFERDRNGAFQSPKQWTRSAVAMSSTHDLPTVAGWWHGSDIALRARTGRLAEGARSDELAAERAADRRLLWQAMEAELAPDGPLPEPQETDRAVDAALRFVARSEAPLCLIPLEDFLGQEAQPNLPGTSDEHPNWRRRLPVPAGSIADDETVKRRMDAMAQERPRQ